MLAALSLLVDLAFAGHYFTQSTVAFANCSWVGAKVPSLTDIGRIAIWFSASFNALR